MRYCSSPISVAVARYFSYIIYSTSFNEDLIPKTSNKASLSREIVLHYSGGLSIVPIEISMILPKQASGIEVLARTLEPHLINCAKRQQHFNSVILHHKSAREV